MGTSKKLAKLLYELGKIYYLGEEIHQNYNEAFSYFKKSAKQNYAPAQNMLGIMYYNGYGVELNYNEAFTWFYKAANQGNDEAQYYLGMIYHDGDLIYDGAYVSDLKKAFYWLTKSANQDNADAKEQLEIMYCLGEGLQVGEYDEDIINKYREVAEQGNNEALHNLYNYFCNQDWYDDAISLLNKATDRGCIFAMNELGDIYYYGDIVDKNYDKASKWYQKSANLGDDYAKKQLKILTDEIDKKNL
jgi:TPR repeat protein